MKSVTNTLGGSHNSVPPPKPAEDITQPNINTSGDIMAREYELHNANED